MSNVTTSQRPRALVVDDDTVLRLAIQQFITRQGFKTSVADDGEKGLALFRRERPDIVLLDAAMPVLDGFETCAAIRALPEGRDVPIIMITIYEDEQSVDHAFRCGANEFITKPIHWAVLRNRVAQLVDAARAERDLRNERAFLQSMVDSVSDPMIVCDRAGLIRWINDAARACSYVGDPAEGQELSLAPGVEQLDEDEPAPGALEVLLRQAVVDAGEPVTLLLARPTPDRGRQYAELFASPLIGETGLAQGAILRFQDVTEREIKEQRLMEKVSRFGKLAYHDNLTGLPNRLLFAERLRSAMQMANRNRERLALLYIDLDGFKAINDTLGHEAGDRVLITVAERLNAVTRQSDTVARLGGDELAVLLTGVQDLDALHRIAVKVLEHIGRQISLPGGPVRVGASIGIAIYPEHSRDTAELVQKADQAMYRVKNGRKNGYCIHGDATPCGALAAPVARAVG